RSCIPAARARSRPSARSCGRSCPTRPPATPPRSPAWRRDSRCRASSKRARSKMRDRAMRRLIPYVAAIVGVALTSVFIGLVVGRTQLANISMLYLVAVLLVAVAFGRAAAIESDPGMLERSAVAARDEPSREALHATGTELRLMDPRRGSSRRIRLVGARLPGRGRERRVHLVPITVSGKHVGRLLLLARTDARELGPADERLLAIGAAQLGVTMERARFRKDALETEVLRRADDL